MNASVSSENKKRIPIRQRVLTAILVLTSVLLVATIITSLAFMHRMRRGGEEMLSAELRRNLTGQVEQKAAETLVRLDEYVRYIELIRDYTESMYPRWDELVATGHFVDTSRASTGVDVYALQSAFTMEDYDLDSFHDEMYFFSHLEDILDPIIRENEDQISTLYLGTVSGLMISYDKWSWLSAVPEPDFFVYDFTQSDWYSLGLTADDVIFTDLYVYYMGRGLTITVAAPFRDPGGTVRGVLAADLDITGIYNSMISMDLGEGAVCLAADEKGMVVGVPGEAETPVGEYLSLTEEEMAALLSGEAGIIETKDAFLAFAPVERVGWTLCAMVPHTVLMGQVETLERSFLSAMLLFVIIALALILAGIGMANQVAGSITHPIELLGEDMRVIADGDLEHKAVVYRNDEIGDVTVGLNEMVDRLKDTICDLVLAREQAEEMHRLANRDALTSVKNKGAFVNSIQELQDRLDRGETPVFGIGVFDCDNLKLINDKFGHDRGDEYLKASSRLICNVFKHSPVFRIGGDEFSVILQGEDFENREALVAQFRAEQAEIRSTHENRWEQVRVAVGIAVFDPAEDETPLDTARRADKRMYADKAPGRGAAVD